MTKVDNAYNPGPLVDDVVQKIRLFKNNFAYWGAKLLACKFIKRMPVELAEPIDECKQALLPRQGSIH